MTPAIVVEGTNGVVNATPPDATLYHLKVYVGMVVAALKAVAKSLTT